MTLDNRCFFVMSFRKVGEHKIEFNELLVHSFP